MKRVAVSFLLIALIGVTACGERTREMPRQGRPEGEWDRPPRPTTLSDPYDDHGPKRCRELLATKDTDLEWNHFQAYFGPLPAGTFTEVVYFLPLAFRHMQDRRDGHYEYLPGFVYWVSRHHEDLVRIGAKEMVATELRRTLDAWTASFVVTHYDKAACQAKEWILEYDDIVEDAQWVAEMVHLLVKEAVFAGVAETFIADLAEASSPTRAAWFLEFARVQAEGLFSPITGEPTPPEQVEEMIEGLREIAAKQGAPLDAEEIESFRRTSRETDAVRSDAIVSMIRSKILLRRAVDVVANSDLFDPAATYWRDTLQLLDIPR